MSARNPENDLIPFLHKKPLLLVIEELAAKKKLNVVLPTVPDVTDEGSLPMHLKNRLLLSTLADGRVYLSSKRGILFRDNGRAKALAY